MSTLQIDTNVIADFCRRHHIRRLSLFGSRLRGDFRPDSDVDLLVEFEPGHIPGYAFFSMQEELSDLLGLPVDFRTPAELNGRFRDEVLRIAEPLYAAQ